jgi:hypothetical protein
MPALDLHPIAAAHRAALTVSGSSRDAGAVEELPSTGSAAAMLIAALPSRRCRLLRHQQHQQQQ